MIYDSASKEGQALFAYRDTDDFRVYTSGLYYASVCTSLSPEEAERRINEIHPSGTTNGWKLSTDENFHTGGANGCPCQQKPDTHRHLLFEC